MVSWRTNLKIKIVLGNRKALSASSKNTDVDTWHLQREFALWGF
jgi:hypothetical protein